MANKKKKALIKEADDRKTASSFFVDQPDKMAGATIASFYVENNFNDPNSGTSLKGLDALVIAEAIEKQQALLAKGDLTSLENMLLSQSYILNTIFTNMAGRMAGAKYTENLEIYGRIALKAQNQTRQTASTLAELKGAKKTTFIHQVNQAHNQQVNNGAGENLTNSANEKVLNNVDRRSEATGEGQNKPDETLALPENTGGQEAISPECLQARHEIERS